MKSSLSIACQIHARRSDEARALGEIARTCARDTGQPLSLEIAPAEASLPHATLTLLLPAELAAGQHQVWCLACRLACFCPDARVSVLVLGAATFAPEMSPAARCA